MFSAVESDGGELKGNDKELLNGWEILSADELIGELCGLGRRCEEREFLVVGFVGYPNVGKSSTLNALCGAKKTPVSATPGKTKHYQVSLGGSLSLNFSLLFNFPLL